MSGQTRLATASVSRDFASRSGRRLYLPLLLLTVSCTAFAQDNPDESDFAEPVVEEIIVTGTRIKRRDFSTITPLFTIDRGTIEGSTQPTIEELLMQMPQIYAANNRTANHMDGMAVVDLRGLGAGRVLVLMNGRRVAPSGMTNVIDMNNIPQYLVERVETITGGTSAVYGSDAIAGVINFITRKDLDGLQVDASYGTTDRGDADIVDVNFSYGQDIGDDRGNVTVYTGYIDRASLNSSERAFTNQPFDQDPRTGELFFAGTALTPPGVIFWPQANLGDGPSFITFNDDGTPRGFLFPDDLVNYLRDSYIQMPLERITAGLLGEFRLDDRFESYVEASYANNKVERRISPAGFGGWVGVNLDNPVLTDETRRLFVDNYACDANLACFDMGRSMSELGPRYHEHDRNYTRIIAGFRGRLTDAWDVDAWLSWTRESSTEHFINGLSVSRGMQGLLVDPQTGDCYDPSNGCVPLDMFGANRLSPAGVDFLRLPPQQMSTDRTHRLASAYVTGTPVETWAGPLDMAFGAEWREDESSYDADEALRNGDAYGIDRRTRISGTDYVYELYGEALVPLMSGVTGADYLGIEVGARYSDYKYSGGLWTYKAGADWRVNQSLRLRVMRQKSMGAPSTAWLFTEPLPVRYFGTDDACSASRDPAGNGIVDNCIASGLAPDQVGVFEADEGYPVDVFFGGNPELQPETARTWTAGIVLTPTSVSNLNMSADYFRLEVEDQIGIAHIEHTCFDTLNDEAALCERLTRDETGNIAAIDATAVNLGGALAEGVDTQVEYSLGPLSLHLLWTHMLSLTDQDSPYSAEYECSGYHGPPCHFTVPKNRATTNLRYTTESISAHLGWRYIDGTKNGAPQISEEWWGIPEPVQAIPEVGDVNYFDLGIRYDVDSNITLRFNVSNLLDEDPPMMFGNGLGINTDTGLYDVFGRSYYLGITMHVGL